MIRMIQCIIAKLLFWIVGIGLKVFYPPFVKWEDKKATKAALKSPVILISNHTGHMDGLYMTELFKRLKVNTYVTNEWYDRKGLRWLFENLSYISIDRKELDTSWLDKGLERINTSESVYMFPEGKTSKTGEVNEFKPGFLVLAKRSGVPVIPICISGGFKFLHPARIVIGAPIEMNLNEEGRPSQVLKKHAEACRQKIVKLNQL